MSCLLRTGPLRRPFNTSSTILAHVEVLNTDDDSLDVTVKVVNLNCCPVTPVCTVTKTIPGGCWQYFNCRIPPRVVHWEVQIETRDKDIIATVYHFRNSVIRDDSLTYRHTELLKDG